MSKPLIDIIAHYIGWDITTTKLAVIEAPKSYRRYEVNKKNGRGKRIIYHPAKSTKSIQYALIDLVLSKLPVHDAATAYKKDLKSPLLHNASTHAQFAYSIRIDVKDFFPSIQPPDLLPIIDTKIQDGGIFGNRTEPLSEFEINLLTYSLFVYKRPNYILAIGAPSSPLISNIVMYDIDVNLSAYAKSSDGIYTRYADDMVYSTNNKGACQSFYNYTKQLFDKIVSPRLLINTDKVNFTSKATKRVITGLFVTPDKTVSIGRKNKRYVKKLVYDSMQNKLTPKQQTYLSGYLCYVLDVEPNFINSLIVKYGYKPVRSAIKN